MKLITFTVPCYNSAAYMDRCIETLLPAGPEAEIILVDDGSTDDTGRIADAYAEKYPGIVRVIHQENGGHGEGVNQGVRHAAGVFFKVVDSDDWLDTEALPKVMDVLRSHAEGEGRIDLLMANYVYEHVADNTRNVVDYTGILPENRVFHWGEIGKFPPNKNILMHSVIYRTEVLRASGMELPKHTFYVDNLFVYQPLPQVNTIYYLNLDLYRYFIGREDQSVNEKNMIKRVDQQLRVTRLMMDAVDVFALPPEQEKLRAYMLNYFSMMMAISSIFLALDGSGEALEKRRRLWADLKAHDERLYRRCRHSVAQGCNLPGWLGCKLSIGGYRIAQKLFKFN
ncbi:MAG TPA: glycosyltransferase [Candidatus Gemmiger avistercoris]|uniref:Glycosyltransferase n=1 Tax=Candidatus Gemmiger avistercoris TaxID=2838606 RepID=A0A9D2FJ02_9FIRM|nr:glycosyltransferase [uncultured Subdoligranulum sp.]HIZ61545.1 glycosyltransferase [Candidatus Gemmiger avistercoris]